MSRLTRRSLLIGASTTALSVQAVNHALAQGAATKVLSGPGGRICLGLAGIAFWQITQPFINIWKLSADMTITAGGQPYYTNFPPSNAKSAWGRFLNENGDLKAPLPAEVTHMSRIISGPNVELGLPPGYNPTGQRWIVKWDGVATNVTIGGGGGVKQRQGANRVEWEWGAGDRAQSVVFTGINHANPPRNIRVCEARLEARLDAGETFHPDWLAEVRRGSGIIRFMDWQATNSNRSTRRFSDIPKESYWRWGSPACSAPPTTTRMPGGMPVSVLASLANTAQSHPWVCFPHVFGTNKTALIEGISNSNPAVVRAPGHNLANGDRVIPYMVYGMLDLNRNTYTIANSDPQAGTFELAGIDSTNFPKYTANGFLTTPFDLNLIEKEVAQFAAYFRDNVGNGLVTYYEYGNELWNTIFDGFHWLAGQARGLFSGDDPNKMAGYLAAHCMNTVRKTYGPANRQRWKGVLTTQTTFPYITKQMLVGVQQYISTKARDVKITDLFDELGVTGYWGGIFTDKFAPITKRWIDDSIARFKAGQEPTRYSYFNRMVSEDLIDARHTKMQGSFVNVFGWWRDQKAIADANGLGLIQYEGGNHNTLTSKTLADDPLYREFWLNTQFSPEDAANHTRMFEGFASLGGHYPSKFVEMGVPTRYGAWGGLRYMGDKNPVWDAVVAFNRRA